MSEVVIVSSGRAVPVEWDGPDHFWILRPSVRGDGVYRAAGWHAAAGPFAATDPRFRVPPREVKP